MAHIINMSVMKAVFGANKKGMTDFLKNFVDNATQTLIEVTNAVHEKKAMEALNLLHRLKGPVGSAGFKAMFEKCESLEKLISQGDWQGAEKCLRTLQQHVANISREVEQLKKQ